MSVYSIWDSCIVAHRLFCLSSCYLRKRVSPVSLIPNPDMNVIPVPPALPRWVWPCSSSLRVLVGVPCDTWRWSVPILPWFVCAAKKNVRLESIVFLVILSVIVFFNNVPNWPLSVVRLSCARNWPFFGIRVTLEHCTAVLPCLCAVSPAMIFIMMSFLANHYSSLNANSAILCSLTVAPRFSKMLLFV